jgi:uncharacterized integral membrane protein
MTNPADEPTPQPAPATEPAPAPSDPSPTSAAPTAPPAIAGTAPPTAGLDRKGRVIRTRVSGVWIGLILGAILLLLLIIFIAQNSAKATVHYLGWSGRLSLGLALLLAAALGVLLVAVPGTVRILQLRRSLRRNAPDRAPGHRRSHARGTQPDPGSHQQ